jgi:hypothetical protein
MVDYNFNEYDEYYERMYDEMLASLEYNAPVKEKKYIVFKRRKYKMKLYFTKQNTNCFIKDAITGIEKEHHVGSKHDHLYYKIRLCNGEYKENNTFYFDCPSTLEKYLQISLDPSIHFKWNEKQYKLKKVLS